MDHGDRIAYIQRTNKVGWKLEFKTRDKIQLPKVEEIIISTPAPEVRRTNVECKAADQGGQLIDGDQSNVAFAEPKSKAGTVSQVTVDETEMESSPHKKSSESSDTVEDRTPGDNDKSTNQVVVKPYECLICQKSFSKSNHLKNHSRSRICTKSSFGKNKVSLKQGIHAIGKSHVCHFCHKSFLYSNHLKNHVKIHKKKSNITTKSFSVENGVNPTGKRPFKCTVCQRPFNQIANMKRHLRIHTGERPYKCSFCPKSFSMSFNMKVHERLHTGVKPYHCVVCTKSFAQSGNLRSHERIHRGRSAYKCSACDGSFPLLSNLKIHFKTHRGRKSAAMRRTNISGVGRKLSQEPSTTSAISHPFNQLNSYVKQLFVENGVIPAPRDQKSTDPIALKPYKCLICQKSFFQSNHLKNHAKSHKKKSNLSVKSFLVEKKVIAASGYSKLPESRVLKPYKCLTCHKSFLHSNHLKNHSKTHKNKSDIGKRTISGIEKRDGNIKVHYLWKQSPPVQNSQAQLQTQAGKKTLHECTICHKSFNQPGNLRTHLRIHTGDKPYKCSFCVKSFRQYCVLKVHERLHTGYRPYKCVVCAKSFSQLANIKAHEKIHIGQRAFQCSVCEGSFSQLSSLKMHFRSHAAEKSAALKRSNISSVGKNLRKSPPTAAVNSFSVIQSNPVVLNSLTNKKERLYKCPICSELFSQSILMSQHLKSHTVKKPYQCPNCPKAFSCQNVMKRHLGIHKLLSWKRTENNVSV